MKWIAFRLLEHNLAGWSTRPGNFDAGFWLPDPCFSISLCDIDLMSDHITKILSLVNRGERAELFGHGGAVLWLTGLSGSGKSTFATQVEFQLYQRGMAAFVLDGDNLRHGLCSNLKFSPEDRAENIRRAGEVAAILAEAGLVAICSFISPYRADRDRVRELCHRGGIPFAEVFVNTPLEVCEARDPRGLYTRARAGEIKDFTGIHSPYEAPVSPELEIRTAEFPMETCLAAVLDLAVSLAEGPSDTPPLSAPRAGMDP